MIKLSVKKPFTVLVVTLAILVLGVVAYTRMTPDLMPNMDFPYVIIITSDPGASPESVEQEITRPIESSMATLDQIKSLTSSSQNSVSMVALEFEDGANMDTLSIDIQQKLTTLQGTWDDTVSAPYMLKINPSMLPVMVAAVSYEGKDVEEVSDFVLKTLEAKLTGVSGVASVDISGTVARQLHVLLDQEKLDELSEEMSEAVSKQLDEALAELEDAEQEALDGKEELKRGWIEFYKGKAEAETQLKQGEEGIKQLKTMLSGGEALLKTAEGLVPLYQGVRLSLTGTPVQKVFPEVENGHDLAYAIANDTTTYIVKTVSAATSATPTPIKEKDLSDFATGWLGIEQGLNATLPKKADGTPYELNKDSLLELSKYINTTEAAFIEGKNKVENGLKEAEEKLTEGQDALDEGLLKIKEGFETIEKNRDELTGEIDLSKTLNMETIGAILTAQDFSMPAGYVSDKAGVQDMVSVGNKIATVEELRELVLFDTGFDGVEVITLGEVATVYEGSNLADLYTKLNGENGVIATFTKQSTYATAESSDNLRERFSELEEEYPGLHFAPLMDQGDYIYLIVESILSSLLWGAAFGILVLVLFLRDWRPTLVTMISIPVSLIFAIVLMYFTGVSINMISLSGLAVAVGMLTDNSVVVIENIYRLRALGVGPVRAAVTGTRQVGGAIAASTLTTVCVFVPIVFVDGLTRQMFTDLALTMTYALMASLIVAMTVVPSLGATLLQKEYAPKKGLLDKIYPLYQKSIRWSLDHKAVVILVTLVLLAGSAYGALIRGFTFMPEMDMNTTTVTVTMPEDCDREQAIELADEVSRRAMTIEGVTYVGAMMGGNDAMSGLMGGDEDTTVATLYITLPEGYSGIKAGKAIEEKCADMDCNVSSTGAMAMMTMLTGDGISLTVYGDDMEELQSAAKMLATRLEGVDGTKEVSDGLEEAAGAVHIAIDREKAMDHGMTVAQVYMQIVSQLTESKTSADMTLSEKTFSVLIETDEVNHIVREEMLDMTITPEGDKEEFKLYEIATVEDTVSLNTISHSEQRRMLTVSATIADGHNVTLVSAEAKKAVEALALPESVTIEWNGENEIIMEAMEQLLLMLLLGIVLVYFVMVAQFQSLKGPFIVMFTLPLAFTGGFIALLLAGIEVSVISMIGFVMLVGIIVNNGIVLVDYVNQLRLHGFERRDALVEAGTTRMRPILMTSLTTILGLVVMAMAENVGTSLMRPVALVCIGGLLYGTLMTLYVVPCMYDIFSKKELRKIEEEDLNWEEEDAIF